MKSLNGTPSSFPGSLSFAYPVDEREPANEVDGTEVLEYNSDKTWKP